MSAPVPYLDLGRQHRELREPILAALAEVVDTTAFVGGKRVTAFEEAFASYCGSRHCVGVANGTDAIKLALMGVGVGRGDEVILPAYTFVATAGAVADCEAVPVLADVDDASALLDPASVVRRLTARTKAVIPVHLYGLPCDPAPLRAALEAAGRADVRIVEDCAQAHGASWRGRRTGALGDVAAFSFYPTKNLGAMGDGGAVTTDDDGIARNVREIGDHGRPADPARRNEHLRPGFNSRLDALQASVLSLKLQRLPDWNATREAAARRYREVLAGRPDVALQALPDGAVHAWYVFAFRHRRRDALMEALGRRGVQARVVYPHALHQYPAWSCLPPGEGGLPRSEAWAREVVTLPMFAGMTVEEADRVLDQLVPALDESRG
jgi:dTDP-4-amino-4,6-dideoxygalactose transaminase